MSTYRIATLAFSALLAALLTGCPETTNGTGNGNRNSNGTSTNGNANGTADDNGNANEGGGNTNGDDGNTNASGDDSNGNGGGDNGNQNSNSGSAGGGRITYRINEGDVFRISAAEGGTPENITEALDALSPRRPDIWLNTSPDGEWLLLNSERFDAECIDYACLTLVAGDLSSGAAIRADGHVVHPDGFAAIGRNGNLIVYPASGGPHAQDLWAIRGDAGNYGAPQLLTADSPYDFNAQPALSADGGRVLFDAGDQPYAAAGTVICEVSTTGNGFRVVLTPADSPDPLPDGGALHHADYASDGSIVFEADWNGERVWSLVADSATPVQIGDFGNDNSPTVLPDGRIVSLWLNRPGGSGFHELKVMNADGSSYIMVLVGQDIADIGTGAGE